MNSQPYFLLPMSKHNRQLGTPALSIRLSQKLHDAVQQIFFFPELCESKTQLQESGELRIRVRTTAMKKKEQECREG